MVDDSHYDTMGLKKPPAAPSRLRLWLTRATEPQFLFPAAAIFMLAVIWGATRNLIRVERAAAERAAVLSSHELAETYEAQLVRALREIDQTLRVVKYAYEFRDRQTVLPELKARSLLPPELLFSVSIADSSGAVVASTHPVPAMNVADQDYFQSQLETDTFSVGSPQRDPATGEWLLNFTHRLSEPDGRLAGVVMLSVAAEYFVSGYEPSTMGDRGVLGLIGTDGVFRARRSGNTVTAGDTIDYATVLRAGGDGETSALLIHSPLDGVLRYTSARELYQFPLALMVGLSADERLASVRAHSRVYLWRAASASLLLLLVVGILNGMSRQLARSRLQTMAEQVAHADRIQQLAFHDGLTKLPNRNMFSKTLSRAMRRAERYGNKLSLLFIDLDRFKYINDTLGHEAGDQLLQEVAMRLKDCLRESDSVARLGGDEFVVLLPESDEDQYVATVAQRMLAALARPFILLGEQYQVTGSVGISSYPQDGTDEQTLMKCADIAMYSAKEQGKNTYQFYSEALTTR